MAEKKPTKRERLEGRLRQMFWDGRLSTPKFDLFTIVGRQQAAAEIAQMLETDEPWEHER